MDAVSAPVCPKKAPVFYILCILTIHLSYKGEICINDSTVLSNIDVKWLIRLMQSVRMFWTRVALLRRLHHVQLAFKDSKGRVSVVMSVNNYHHEWVNGEYVNWIEMSAPASACCSDAKLAAACDDLFVFQHNTYSSRAVLTVWFRFYERLYRSFGHSMPRQAEIFRSLGLKVVPRSMSECEDSGLRSTAVLESEEG